MEEGKKMEDGCRESIPPKTTEEAIKKAVSEEDLRLYKVLGEDLYQLPGNIITGKRGLEQYLKEFKKMLTI